MIRALRMNCDLCYLLMHQHTVIGNTDDMLALIIEPRQSLMFWLPLHLMMLPYAVAAHSFDGVGGAGSLGDRAHDRGRRIQRHRKPHRPVVDAHIEGGVTIQL